MGASDGALANSTTCKKKLAKRSSLLLVAIVPLCILKQGFLCMESGLKFGHAGQGAAKSDRSNNAITGVRTARFSAVRASAPSAPSAPSARCAGNANAEMEQFLMPEKRWWGHRPLAVARALGLLLAIYATGVVFVTFIFFSLPVVKRRDPAKRRLIDDTIAAWSRSAVVPFFSVKVLGRENLPERGQACVYVANHQSFMDILSCSHLLRPFKWVSKASILKLPLIGWAMRAAKTITIEREDRKSQLQTFRDSVEALKNGISLFVFPEGTRSKDGKLLEFKKGPFAMAKKAGVPILPITIRGTGRMMPSGKEFFLFRSGAGSELVVHPLITAQEVADTTEADLSLRVRNIIESEMPLSLRGSSIS